MRRNFLLPAAAAGLNSGRKLDRRGGLNSAGEAIKKPRAGRADAGLTSAYGAGGLGRRPSTFLTGVRPICSRRVDTTLRRRSACSLTLRQGRSQGVGPRSGARQAFQPRSRPCVPIPERGDHALARHSGATSPTVAAVGTVRWAHWPTPIKTPLWSSVA